MLINEISKPNWYLLYTMPRAEKQVESTLKSRGYEVFLPLQTVVRQWSDRKKVIHEPLFKSYVFINVEIEKAFYQVKGVPGVVNFVSFGKNPVKVDFREINLLKLIDFENLPVEANNMELEVGNLIEVFDGPLRGIKGKYLNDKGANQMIVELNSINQSIVLTINRKHIRKI